MSIDTVDVVQAYDQTENDGLVADTPHEHE